MFPSRDVEGARIGFKQGLTWRLSKIEHSRRRKRPGFNPQESDRTQPAVERLIASMGTERIAPGTPHIQNQKASEMMRTTGLSVNRRARSIGVTVSLLGLALAAARRAKGYAGATAASRIRRHRVQGATANSAARVSVPSAMASERPAERGVTAHRVGS
jgi:hypothetical protein